MDNTGIKQAASPCIWTGGQKAGWFFVGMLLGIPGILVASLCNVSHPDRSTATKMAAIGVAAWVAVFLMIFLVAACSTAAVVSSVASVY